MAKDDEKKGKKDAKKLDKKDSPKKEKKVSPKKDKKESPKDKKNTKKGNKTDDGAEENIQKIFARKRYENMDAVFKRQSKRIILLTNRVHIWETWNKLPVVTQMCNSNEETVEENEEKPKLFEPAMLEGIVYINKKIVGPNEGLYVEVTAEYRYHSKSIVPPIPPRLELHDYCYRDYFRIYPIAFDRQVPPTEFNQRLIKKCWDEFPGLDGIPFCFDLTGTPDSIFLNRPHFTLPDSGIFWKVRSYIAEMEYCRPKPEMEISMNFWKYTYAPLIPNELPRESNPMNYIRYQTTNDVGDLLLTAQLDRDVYYHGENINVTVSIENNSLRHVVTSVFVYVEQTIRVYRDVRQDYSIRLGEVLLLPPNDGLPIQPKSKSFQKKIELTPRLDLLVYNVGIDGHMAREKKYFLAGSTIILKTVPLTNEEIAAEEESKELAIKGGGKGGKGKGSPGKKGSPDKKGSPNKPSPSKKDGPQKQSPEKKGSPENKKSIKEITNENEDKENNPDEENVAEPIKIPEKNILVNKHRHRTIQTAYDIVVRLNLKTVNDEESGNPQVRVPFVLTRETWLIDKWSIADAFLDMAKKEL